MFNENQNEGKVKRIWNAAKDFVANHWRATFHFIVLCILTVYVVRNWADCIKMQFFQDFDGNNILFLTWIILIFFIIYDVEAKGIKIKRRELKQELEQNSMLYSIEARQDMFRSIESAQDEEGDDKHD